MRRKADASYMTIEEACKLLQISRPTLNSYRKKHRIKENKVKREIRLDKLDVLKKLYLPNKDTAPELIFTVTNTFDVDDCEIAKDVFDFRLIKEIDPFGAICLLCRIRTRIRDQAAVSLLSDKRSTSAYLRDIGLFAELSRLDSRQVHFDDATLLKPDRTPADVILPLHIIGYRGGEKAILDVLYRQLAAQGFSEDLRSSLGWVLGELADNAATHATGPCYVMLTSRETDQKILVLTVGDIGGGIPKTIKSKAVYSGLSDMQALIWAFKSGVSSWDDKHERGKGLNDILGVAKGNRGNVRAESNGRAVRFDFKSGSHCCSVGDAGTQSDGTRYCIVLTDSEFAATTKSEIDQMLDKFVEEL
jgi:excisionase family DNA binding protein